MIKICLSALLISFTTFSYAQNTFPSSGNVGIGTLNAITTFQVQKNSSAPAVMIGGGFGGSPRLQLYGFDSDANAWMGLGTDMNGGPYEHSVYFPSANKGRLTIGDYNGSIYNVRMSVLNNGNVGIGTTTPAYSLQVQKTSTAPAIMIGGGFSGGPRLQVYGLDADPSGWMGLGTDMGGGPYEHSVYFPASPSGNDGKLTIGDYNGGTYNARLTVLSNGNVGIGTKLPKERLSVYGTIRATEVKVETANWPDYVFHESYKVRTLPELEDFIKRYKHLPEIPTTAEIEKNGVELGQVNAKLLQKVEELTLYMIQMNKELIKLKAENARLTHPKSKTHKK
jgi:hypothetical protein